MGRHALLACILLATSAASVPAIAEEAKPPAKSTFHTLLQTPAGFRFMVGDFEVTALSDGSCLLDCYEALTNIEHEKINQLLDESNQKSPAETSINVFLIKTRDHIVLVDTGSGDVFGPKMGGLLVSALAANAVQPNQVTDICITHVHSDHSGGLVR